MKSAVENAEYIGFEQSYIVLDFETTGLTPDRHRIIEVGAYRIQNGKIIDHFQALMSPGRKLPSFIVKFTGITDEMLHGKPTPEQIMPDLYEFIQNFPIICHNASFDSKFLMAEMKRVKIDIQNKFICTLLLSRRIFSTVKSHKLSNLRSTFKIDIPSEHRAHRALDDAYVTVSIFNLIASEIIKISGKRVITPDEYQQVSKVPKANVKIFLQSMEKSTATINLGPKEIISSCTMQASAIVIQKELVTSKVEGTVRVTKKRKTIASVFSRRKSSRKI